MTPSWKFRDVPQAGSSTPPFYVQRWPDDLPDKCGVCGTVFRFGFNLTIGAGKAGRILRSIAYFGFLPFILIGLILPGIFPEFYGALRGSHGWWLVFGVMFFPPMFLGGLSMAMPQTRHVECKKCGWNHDYGIRKPKPLPPAPSVRRRHGGLESWREERNHPEHSARLEAARKKSDRREAKELQNNKLPN